MIDEMPCAYGTQHVASRPIYILLMYPTNPFWRMVTVGHNATVFVYIRIPTEPDEMAKLRSEGDMQRDALLRRWERSSLPPVWLWWLRRSMSTLTEPFRPDGIVFCWCMSVAKLTMSGMWEWGCQSCGSKARSKVNCQLIVNPDPLLPAKPDPPVPAKPNPPLPAGY